MIKTTEHSERFKAEEVEQLEKNLNAFTANFSEPILHKYKHGAIEVYMTKEEVNTGSYIQYCDNLDYLNGWFYGAVQAKNNIIR